MNKPKLKILSVDGGGIRGILPCTVLKFIEEQLGSLSTFDLMAGTSTGGIVVAGLNTVNPQIDKEFSAQDLLELYVQYGQEIFSHREEDFLSKIAKIAGSKIGKIAEKPYDKTSLENLLERYFGSTKLNQLKRDILVTTYDFKSGRPFYFSSRLAKEDEKENYYLREMARATSAAPTYFEPHLNQYNENQEVLFIDGGIFANNPSILAYTEAKELHKIRQHRQAFAYGKRTFDSVVNTHDDDLPFYLLSIGTGSGKFETSTTSVDNWRSANWILPLLTDTYMRSVSESTHYTMQHLLPAFHDGTPRYQRLNFNIPAANSAMDNITTENINQLQEIGTQYIRENKDELMKICEILS